MSETIKTLPQPIIMINSFIMRQGETAVLSASALEDDHPAETAVSKMTILLMATSNHADAALEMNDEVRISWPEPSTIGASFDFAGSYIELRNVAQNPIVVSAYCTSFAFCPV